MLHASESTVKLDEASKAWIRRLVISETKILNWKLLGRQNYNSSNKYRHKIFEILERSIQMIQFVYEIFLLKLLRVRSDQSLELPFWYLGNKI